jgi:hypothetical protein
MRGAARDRHGLRGGMRWRRRGVRCPSIAPGQPCVLTRADDRAAAMTAQTARSRRSRLCARRQNHRTPCAPVARQSSTIGGPTHMGRPPGALFAEQAGKSAAHGTPGVSGVFVATTLVCFFIFAHEAADASRVRRSVRPLDGEGGNANFSASPAP